MHQGGGLANLASQLKRMINVSERSFGTPESKESRIDSTKSPPNINAKTCRQGAMLFRVVKRNRLIVMRSAFRMSL